MSALTVNERVELIDALVTNCTGWGEEDREYLGSLGDDRLKGHAERCVENRMAREIIANAEAETDEEDEGEECEEYDEEGNCKDGESDEDEGDEEVTGNQQMTFDDWMSIAPPEVQSVVQEAIDFQNAQKEQVISRITANRRNRFSKEYLHDMSLNELNALAELAVPVQTKPVLNRPMPVYQGAAAPILNEEADDSDDILIPPTMHFGS